MSFVYKQKTNTEKSLPFKVALFPSQNINLSKGSNIKFDGHIRKIESIRKIEMKDGVIWLYGKCR